MTKEEQIKDWFIHQLWPIYPGKWCRSGKGSRQEALNQMLKINPDQDERKRILLNLEAQIRADKGNQNRKWWSLGKTYVFNQMWEDPIEAQDEDIKQKDYCQCGKPVDHAGFGVCWGCYDKWQEERNRQNHKQLLSSLNLYKEGQSLREVSQSCRDALLNKNASSIVAKTAKKLQMNSIDSVLKSSQQNAVEDSGLNQTHPTGSKEWFEQNHPETPTEYDREQGLHLLGDKK